ncbi:MAG: twin-arginine translocase subunit TatC [Bacteroidetes bacterium]|nr:twin arginine-targeting protein translocase TatC [Rhodothermaceae bacterium RA]RMH65275.1 MAG: twin-arginine translocase subunit TatC [Bacteroidota bacterium]
MKWFGSRTSTAIPEQTGAHGDGAAGTVRPPHEEDYAMEEMGFLDHLEELRWSLIKGLSAILVSTIVCAFFSRWILDVLLLGPTRASFFMYDVFGIDAVDLVLQNRTITGQFFAHIGTVLVVGIIVGSPIFVYYLWKFIEPGLYPNEKEGMRFAAFFASLCFFLGILFGYLVITPLALQFFANYTISEMIINEFDITKYFSMVTFWSFGVGLLFELPVVVYFLSKLGLLTPELMRNYRKFALILVLILGALLTPPDPISQVLVAMPLMLLYELSIKIAAYTTRKRERELREALG